MPTINKKYLDLDGLSYYNSKLQEQFSESFDDVNGDVARLSDEVEALASMNNYAPIPVSSVSAMTDHSRVYVLTTDGRWYYWDSTLGAWTPGGTYQASSLGDNSVSFGNLNNRLAGFVTEPSNDVTKLNVISTSPNANGANITSPILLKAGTTISISEDFLENYKWCLRRIDPTLPIKIASGPAYVNSWSSDTSYTLLNDEICAFQWLPIDENWNTETYTVDRNHKLDNSDVTIPYYWSKDDRYKLIDINSNEVYNTLFCGVYYEGGICNYTYTRLSSTRLFSAYPILLHIKGNYDYDVSYYADNVSGSARTSHTGWSSADIIIPANKWFTLTFRHTDNGQFLTTDYGDFFELNSYANYSYVTNYVDNHISSIGTYNYDGIDLDMQYKHGYEISASTSIPEGYRSNQGMCVYGNYIFQFTGGSTGILRIFERTSGSLVAEHQNIYSGHGGSCAFSNTFADADDDFPLLYVSTCDYNQQITVLRVQDVNTVNVYKSYYLDSNKVGYWSQQCYDFETGLCYSFGYTQNSFTESTNNPVKVAIFDMNKEVTNENQTIRFELVDSYEIPYVYVIQSCKFLNGLCYILSSYQSIVQTSNILVFDASARAFVADFPNIPSALQGELEGIDFVKNTSTGKYDMIIGVNGDPNYWKLSFM